MKNVQPAPPPPRRAYTVKSLVKALGILDFLAEGEQPAYTVTELSRQLLLNKTTVHRLVSNLLSQGYIEEAPGGRGYQLSFKVMRMGLQVLYRMDFRRVAEPLLKQLNQQTQETAQLAILHETEAVIVQSFGNRQSASLEVRFGGTVPLHCTGVGKTLLAFQKGGLLTQVSRKLGFPRFTPKTITQLANLRKELERIREQGYALDQEEAIEGLSGVAGPVFDDTGRVVAALGVSGLAASFTPSRIPEIARLVCSTGEKVSFRLGYRRR